LRQTDLDVTDVTEADLFTIRNAVLAYAVDNSDISVAAIERVDLITSGDGIKATIVFKETVTRTLAALASTALTVSTLLLLLVSVCTPSFLWWVALPFSLVLTATHCLQACLSMHRSHTM
jgi:hypothetical protein